MQKRMSHGKRFVCKARNGIERARDIRLVNHLGQTENAKKFRLCNRAKNICGIECSFPDGFQFACHWPQQPRQAGDRHLGLQQAAAFVALFAEIEIGLRIKHLDEDLAFVRSSRKTIFQINFVESD